MTFFHPQRQLFYTHRCIWDNRCTMHRGAELDDLRWKRDVPRATVSDAMNTCEQARIAVETA